MAHIKGNHLTYTERQEKPALNAAKGVREMVFISKPSQKKIEKRET